MTRVPVLRILAPVDGSENALRALCHILSARDLCREPIELHLLNVHLPVASGAAKMFIGQHQLNDHYRDEGLAALKEAHCSTRPACPSSITSGWATAAGIACRTSIARLVPCRT